MRTNRWPALLLLLLALALPLPAGAQTTPAPDGRDPAFEAEIAARLGAIDPAAVPLFEEATLASDAGDLEAARRGFEAVLALAPGFPDALRRLSYVELVLGETEAAAGHARQALEADPSPYNQMALSRALSVSDAPADHTEALRLAKAAAAALPDEADAQFALFMAAAANQDAASWRQATDRLLVLAPDDPLVHYVAGLLAGEEGHWREAERELLRAQELGMPAEDVQRALDEGVRTQARLQRALIGGGIAVGAWLGGLALLLVLGLALSRLTLRAVGRTQATGQFEVGRGERAVRGAYRAVIALTSVYFYISIPFLIAVTLAVAGGLIYGMLSLGQVPVRLLLFVGLAAVYTLIAIVRSLFIRFRDEAPGRPLPPEEAPGLWSLAREVALRVGTRPIDAVYITPGTDLAVTERGGAWRRLRDRGERSLVLGLGALPGLEQGSFRAILAHEYGHFSNRDTAGGDLAGRVLASIHRMGYGLARSGQAAWYNPAWLFVNGFLRIFLRVALGASRLQEMLADRYAALAYGAQTFARGLKQVIHQDLAFRLAVNREAQAADGQKRALRNLYTLPPLPQEALDELDKAEAEILARPTSPYDSHPAPADRLALLERLPEAGPDEKDPAPAWELLPNREQLQAEMMEVVRRNVEQRG